MLQACLNGGRSKSDAPNIPVSAVEIAGDARAVCNAGADELHIHPRGLSGLESLYMDDVAACLNAVRTAVPGTPIGVGTSAWIKPGLQLRLAQISEWDVLPDYASVNLCEQDAFENMDVLLSKNIGIEAGIWNADDARRFVGSPYVDNCLRILVEMTSDDPDEAAREYFEIKSILAASETNLPILLHGNGGSVWPMVRLAKLEGHSTRVGFEDVLTLPGSKTAENNAQFVATAIRLMNSD